MMFMTKTVIGFHGTHTPVLHVGFCIADSYESAEGYAVKQNAGRIVAEVEIDLTGLSYADADDFSSDSDGEFVALGDTIPADYDGPDVITYLDRDMDDQTHRTWRLMTTAAVAAATITATYPIDI